MNDKIAKIAELFPNCIVETTDSEGHLKHAIDFKKLRLMLGDEVTDDDVECFDFTWVGKNAAIQKLNKHIDKTLRPCMEESVNWNDTKNLYIEGDNLEVLKLLQNSYYNSVKLIYIDPPYNTGKDFIYRDKRQMSKQDYAEETELFDDEGDKNFIENAATNPRFHSDWCNMIYPRLLAARNLLSEDGLIFISIDDNEQASLKNICDEVFGNDNFVSQIVVVSNPSGRDYGGIARMHDYILVYRKSDYAKINLIRAEDKTSKMTDQLGEFELRELRNRNIRFNKQNRPNLYYPFYINPNEADENGLYKIDINPNDGWIELYPKPSQDIDTVWRWGKEKAAKNLNINIMAKSMKDGRYMIVEKYRESKKMARSVWSDKDMSTEKGTLLLKKFFRVKFLTIRKASI